MSIQVSVPWTGIFIGHNLQKTSPLCVYEKLHVQHNHLTQLRKINGTTRHLKTFLETSTRFRTDLWKQVCR